VSETACGALRNLANDDALAHALADMGAVPCVVKALETHLHKDAVVFRACGALRALCTSAAAGALRESGACALLVRCLSAYADNAEIAEQVCEAVGRLCGDADAARALADLGAAEALGALHSESARRALRALAAADNGAAALDDGVGVTSIVC